MSRADRARALYPDGRPTTVARRIQARFMKIAALGIVPASAVLETRGRTSGLVRKVPIVIGRHDGQRYLVSMLGPDVDWIRNAEADHGRAVLVHGRREPVRLVEVPVDDRAPIIKDYLRVAPGARPHIRVDRKAPVGEFATVAGDHPVFRIVPESAQYEEPAG